MSFSASRSSSDPGRFFVYGLVDPNSGLIRYVGLSTRGLDRPLEHFCDKTQTYRGRWIRSLKKRGMIPSIRILEKCGMASLPAREQHWIKRLREEGCPLTNHTEGGEPFQTNVSLNRRRQISECLKGYKHTPQARANMSSSRKGYKMSAAAKAKLSKARMGLKHTPETLIKLSAAKKGGTLTAEHREKIGVGLRKAYAEGRHTRPTTFPNLKKSST